MLMNSPRTQPDFFELIVWRAVDGDTLDALVRVPLGLATNRRLRLKGFYAPELQGRTPDLGTTAQLRLEGFLHGKCVGFYSRGMKEDKYGRLVVELVVDGEIVKPEDVLGPLLLTVEQHRADVAFQRERGGRRGGSL